METKLQTAATTRLYVRGRRNKEAGLKFITTKKCTTGALLLTAAFFLVSCSHSNGPINALVASDSAASTTDNASMGRSRYCTLLTDDEVTSAIGPHAAATSDLITTWGEHGCRWKSTTAQKMDGYPDGWFDAIEVGVFDKNDDWARRQMKGEPVSNFVESAVYDRSYGQLWFACAGGRTCVIEMRTASGKKREETALQLARLINQRVK